MSVCVCRGVDRIRDKLWLLTGHLLGDLFAVFPPFKSTTFSVSPYEHLNKLSQLKLSEDSKGFRFKLL